MHGPESGRTDWRPISPPACTGARDGALPAYVSNGLIGLRVREMAFAPGMAVVNGVAGLDPTRRIEAAVPVPYPLAVDIRVNGVWLSDQPWSVSDLEQTYDFATAELTTQWQVLLAGIAVGIEVVTLASRTAPSVVQQSVTLVPEVACDLSVRAQVAIDGVRGTVVRRRTQTPGDPEPACDGSLLWATEGDLSTCGIAIACETRPPAEPRTVSWDRQGPLQVTFDLGRIGRKGAHLHQMAALVPSVAHDRPDEEAVRRLARARETGFEVLRDRNREAWRDLWRGRIRIEGADPRHQALVDAAYFYLNASVHAASPAATSIFGLATWHDYHYYYGHVMWDIDAFCVPPLLFSQPDAAHALLDFRWRGRSAAAANARLSTRQGLQFPWEAAPLSGQEATPGAGSAAAHEDHGSLHIARAFDQYAMATGDARFARDRAWPILSGVADWAVSRVTLTGRGYELLRATGPAEVPDPPDNDAFTLMLMRDVLERAILAAERLGEPVPAVWNAVRDGLYLPLRQDGAIAAHDDFRITEPKGATPSPLAGLFPGDYTIASPNRQATLDLYLKHWKAYVGSPMFPALYPVWAAMAGDRALALELFEAGYAAYDAGRFHQCLEYRPDHPDSETAAGPFFANLGGMLLGLVLGLPGLEVNGPPEDWASRPVVLPSGWDAITVDRLWIEGQPWSLRAEQGAERARLERA